MMVEVMRATARAGSGDSAAAIAPVRLITLEEPLGKVCFGETYFAASTAHCPLWQTADCGTDAPTLAQCEISALVHAEWRS